MTGYEYEIVSYCQKSKKPVVAPRVWSTQKTPRPLYNTCSCCPHKK